MRYFLEIAYAGTHYHGWQAQPNAVTVQGTLEAQLAVLMRAPVPITGSGRTDTGVHACQQFAHFDVDTPLAPTEFVRKLNGLLPADIAVHGLWRVPDAGHARFDALLRSYQYRISRRKDPFQPRGFYLYDRPLDVRRMNQAAALLPDYEDFRAFSRTHTDVNHFRCHLTEARWEDLGTHLVFHVSANRFLRGMVRALTGTLIEVGLGRRSLADFRRTLRSGDRQQAGWAAPPHGLYLTKVAYPTGFLQDAGVISDQSDAALGGEGQR